MAGAVVKMLSDYMKSNGLGIKFSDQIEKQIEDEEMQRRLQEERGNAASKDLMKKKKPELPGGVRG